MVLCWQPDGGALKLTVAEYLTPNKVCHLTYPSTPPYHPLSLFTHPTSTVTLSLSEHPMTTNV